MMTTLQWTSSSKCCARFFSMNVESATQVMLKVHTEGKGVCGVFGKDVAESKASQVNEYARECEQPLLCSVEVDR